jgi:hypothetical protein
VKENLIATRLRFRSLKEDANALNSKNSTWVLSFTSFFFGFQLPECGVAIVSCML